MKGLIALFFAIVMLSSIALALEVDINKDSKNTELVITDTGFGYKTFVDTTESSVILNIPPNVEIISISPSPQRMEDITYKFLIFEFYRGKRIYFENSNHIEIVFRYPEGFGQFSTSLYDSINSVYS